MQSLNQSQLSQIFNQSTSSPQKRNKQRLKINQKCIGGNALYQFCINEKCEQINKFVCFDQDCQCNQNHQFCKKGQIKVIIKQINGKLKMQTDQLKKHVSQVCANMANKISQFQQNILNEIQNDLKYIQLSQLQKNFHSVFMRQQRQNLKLFDGSKLIKLWDDIYANIINTQRSQQLYKNYQKKIDDFEKICLQTIEKNNKQINRMFKDFNHNKQESMNRRQRIQTIMKYPQKILFQNQINFLNSSSILVDGQKLQNLIKMFPDKINNLTLKYKASLNNFSLSKYFYDFGSLQNIIIICETNAYKIIGGFTPLYLRCSGYRDQNASDHSKNSFVFSLTNNDKFELKESEYALYRYQKNSCICFGGQILRIHDKANVQNNVSNFIKKCYFNQKYTDNKQSYLLFNGNQDKNFTIKQWEVYSVQFK